MNRLQKKCVIATAGFHLLLLVILFVGPAFFNAKPKVDDSQVLDVIPANLIDAAFNSGVKGAQPPPPQPQPAPPAPKIVQPVPQPTITERLEKFFTPAPVKPAPAPVENQPHTPKVDLHLVTRNAPKNSTLAKSKDNSAAAKDLARSLKSLKSKLSSATKVDMPGESSAAYAPYASAVKSIYDSAWALPGSIVNADENIKVSVTIARDGSVISSQIITPSGDATADESVQKTLNRVQFIAPFPDSWTDKERTFTIIFNPQVKSSE